MPDFALCGMTRCSCSVGKAVSESALNLLGTSVPGYMYLAANPLPDKAFFQLVTLVLNDKCSPWVLGLLTVHQMGTPRLLTSAEVLTTKECTSYE